MTMASDHTITHHDRLNLGSMSSWHPDIYTLFVGSEPGKMDAAVVRGFFASFQLTV